MARTAKKKDSFHNDSDIELEAVESEPLSHKPLSGGTPSLFTAAAVVVRPFLARGSPTRRRGAALITGMLVTLLAESMLLLVFSEVQKGYMTALEQKNSKRFYEGLWNVGGVILCVVPTIGLHCYLQESLATEWRAAITRSLAGCYLAGRGASGQGLFYKLHMDGSLDNPDQRICQDTADLVTNGLKLSVDVCSSILRLLGFVAVLYRISPGICAGIFLYAAVSTLGAVLGFGPRMFKYQTLITQQEATLRYLLIRVRENAESIAFFRGGLMEWHKFEALFATLVNTVYQRIRQICGFLMFTSAIRFATFAVPVLLVGPSYMRGEAEFGQISQVSFAFHMIFDALMLITSKVPDFSRLAVQMSRLHALHQVLLHQEPARSSVAAPHSVAVGWQNDFVTTSIALWEVPLARDEDLVLDVQGVTLLTPSRQGAQQQTLLKDITFQLKGGTSLLIVGESGIGKSSLLRAIAGLWSDGQGSITRCGAGAAFFMPQRPYMCLGTLQEQLMYPHSNSLVSAQDIRTALQDVRLEYLFDRHGLLTEHDWSTILSLGEQQRINFARVLLQPELKLALLDEGTSACDPENEMHLYDALKRKLKSFVSVGHRPGLRRFHTHVLLLERDKRTSDGQTTPAKYSLMTVAEFESLNSLA
mmetsp:Transcript_600/g.1856  ORF Transcript_600/g.1856 Transcript_600/m.1856 type:complete len:646 (-) Transcript_600:46-1983(-)